MKSEVGVGGEDCFCTLSVGGQTTYYCPACSPCFFYFCGSLMEGRGENVLNFSLYPGPRSNVAMPNQQAPIWKVLQPTKPKIELNEINDLLLANVGGHLHHPPFAVVNLVLSVSQSVSLTFLLHCITSPRMEIDDAFQGHRYHNYRYKILEESFLGILRVYVTRVFLISYQREKSYVKPKKT